MESFWTVVLVLVFVVFLGMAIFVWGTETQGDAITEEACQVLGFDGQISVGSERFCYTTCPFDLAISGECKP